MYKLQAETSVLNRSSAINGMINRGGPFGLPNSSDAGVAHDDLPPKRQSSAGQDSMESRPKVSVEKRVDARVDSGREVTQPHEGLKKSGRNIAVRAHAVNEVRAEKWQPEDDEDCKDPNESSLCSSLSAVNFERTSRGQHVQIKKGL